MLVAAWTTSERILLGAVGALFCWEGRKTLRRLWHMDPGTDGLSESKRRGPRLAPRARAGVPLALGFFAAGLYGIIDAAANGLPRLAWIAASVVVGALALSSTVLWWLDRPKS